MITWTTPAGSLGTLIERIVTNIPLQVSSDVGSVSLSIISGSLPRGLRLNGASIKGSPVEVKKFTTSRFVIRASDGVDIEDRTFSLSVDGSDEPQWITNEGFLNVGKGAAYFVLDNDIVDFQLEVDDTDLTAGDVLEFSLLPNGGLLPPGLSLSKDGKITGFTDPIFALEYSSNPYGGYDTAPLDAVPIDFVEARSNGYDTFFYDDTTFDYNEPSRTPRRLSRIYTFAVAVTDGIYTITRIFKIYVVTEEFLQADNSIVQVDTNLFQADASSYRTPIWITESNLGQFRSNNYVTIFLDVYDPPTLSGTLVYYKTSGEFPPGLILDSITGEIAGRVPYQDRVTQTYTFTMQAVNYPSILATADYEFKGIWNNSITYQVNDTVRYINDIFVCIAENKGRLPSNSDFWTQGTSSSSKIFTVDVIGEIETAISWKTQNDLGTIKPNQPSQLFVEAESLLYGGRVAYEFVSGNLPSGLEFLPTGLIQGKVKQFADADGPGLLRFYERDSSIADSTGSKDFNVTFDGGDTTFDKIFRFTIRARDSVNLAEITKLFTIRVDSNQNKSFANLYLKAFQSKQKRLSWYNFITDSTIFKPELLYRYGDTNYGVQTDLRMLLYAGIESTEAVKYVQAMSRNHYNKRILFGNVNSAKAKDPDTQETLYEIVYVEMIDEYQKNGTSISQTIDLPDYINSRVLVSYDAIKVDSDIPFVSDRDHQRVFPNSFKNMRRRIKTVGERDRELLPLWMRSIQDQSSYETGWVSVMPLCFAKPGSSTEIIARIKASNFDFKSIDFEADRYIIDILDGEIEDKYLAFPQRGEKLP
jgi:hypothetical protein